MITGRRYFSIVLLFLAVLVLFQGLQLGRILVSEIHVNKHISQSGLTASDVRGTLPMTELGGAVPEPPYLLYVGALDSPYVETLEEWAAYEDKTLCHSETLTVPEETEALPELLLLSPECLAGSAEALEWYTSRGVDAICMALPDVRVLEKDPLLQRLLGILEIRQRQVTLKGIKLFSGFLLGGERIYQEETPGDPRQDLELTVPWYVTRERTKTFLQGLLTREGEKAADREKLENEDLPSLIWSSHMNRGEIYSICGDYFSSRKLALGILAAVEYERRDYSLYPVVNAQLLSMMDYPIAADENSEQMRQVYGREMTQFESVIVVPQLQSLASRHDYRATCYMAPKYDYGDDAPVKQDFIHHYLSILHDTEGELGLNLRYVGPVSLEEKLDNDAKFYLAEGSEYPVHGAYVDAELLDQALQILPEHPVWHSVRAISLSPAEDLPLLGFVTEEIAIQQITSNTQEHTFFQDLELLGLETALGYDNAALYMADSFWPQTQAQNWENASRIAFENMATYYAPFTVFDRVTISESDARVRAFLHRTYTLTREGNELRLTLLELDDTASFILRTHNEEVTSVVGAACRQIEDDAYLIVPDGTSVTIRLYSQFAKLLHPEVGF